MKNEKGIRCSAYDPAKFLLKPTYFEIPQMVEMWSLI